MPIIDIDYNSDENASTPAKKEPLKKVEPAQPDNRGFFERHFMPGGVGDALMRSFSSGATLGMAPRISAFTRSGDTQENLKEELAKNRAAEASYPTASTVANLAGSAPSMMWGGVGGIGSQVAKNAAIAGANAYGSSDKSGANMAKDIGQSALIGGGIAGALPVISKAGGVVSDIVRGTPDPNRLKDAAIVFKNTPTPSTVGQVAPRSAKNAWAELNAGGSKEATDQLIREGGHAIEGDTARAVIAQHNATTSPIKDIIQNAGTGAGIGGLTGAGGTFMTTGDIGSSIQGGILGASAGALAGAKKAAMAPSAKLRMPGTEIISPEAKRNFSQANSALSQMGARDINEATNAPSSNFGTLADYFRKQNIPENDDEAKRRAAMELQTTPEGRAIGNDDSPQRKSVIDIE